MSKPSVAATGAAGMARTMMGTASLLRNFDASAVGALARSETRNREVHLPVISLYRWWARRTTAVASALCDAASQAANANKLTVADPFAGGGVIALSALLRGHTVLAQELDPWAAQNLGTMAYGGNPDELRAVARALAATHGRGTDRYAIVLPDGTPARAATTLRVATAPCPTCATKVRLFPAAIVSRTARVDTKAGRTASAWFACRRGHLHSSRVITHPCPDCGVRVRPKERYTTGRVVRCWSCGIYTPVGRLMSQQPTWEVVLVERIAGRIRDIGPPTADELDNAGYSGRRQKLGVVPAGPDLAQLTNWGFRDFADLYPTRQLALLNRLLAAVDGFDGVSHWAKQVARAAIIGSAEFAGYATRWDPNYLKPYETVASHRYNVTTLAAEIDPWGEGLRGRGTICRRLAAAADAAQWMGDQVGHGTVHKRQANGRRTPLCAGLTVVTGSSESIPAPDASVDLILTDPPYHDDVQYADLASLFRSWAGHPLGRLPGDVTAPRSGGDAAMEAFQAALTAVFSECLRVIKRDGHLVLSFANRNVDAWTALLEALHDNGWHGAGFEVVHAENETDHSKSGRRACNLDVLLDLVPGPVAERDQHRPSRRPATDEEAFCFAVGEAVLSVGQPAGIPGLAAAAGLGFIAAPVRSEETPA